LRLPQALDIWADEEVAGGTAQQEIAADSDGGRFHLDAEFVVRPPLG
jgi:hypothetical protein